MNVELSFEKRYRLVREVIETIVLTLLMFLVINLAVQNFDVDGPSMEPSLHNQERLMVDKWTYLFHPPTRGDIIVFVAPPHPELDYVKRIIGLPGDVITIRNTTVIVDGVTLNDTFVSPVYQGNPFAAKQIENLVVPPNNYFVLGDDRKFSSDSRDWGFVPRKNIIGRAALIYWPLRMDNDGLLPNVSPVFVNVHQQASTPAKPAQNAQNIIFADTVLLCISPAFVIGIRTKRRRRTAANRRERKNT